MCDHSSETKYAYIPAGCYTSTVLRRSRLSPSIVMSNAKSGIVGIIMLDNIDTIAGQHSRELDKTRHRPAKRSTLSLSFFRDFDASRRIAFPRGVVVGTRKIPASRLRRYVAAVASISEPRGHPYRLANLEIIRIFIDLLELPPTTRTANVNPGPISYNRSVRLQTIFFPRKMLLHRV